MRSQKCTVCKHEAINQIEQQYRLLEKNITKLAVFVQNQFVSEGRKPLSYSSLRRHFKVGKGHYDHSLQRSTLFPASEEEDEENSGDLTETEMEILKKEIEVKGLIGLSMDEIIQNAKLNKDINKENAERLRALVPEIDTVYDMADTNKTRLDCLKMKKDITMAINKLETEFIQIDLKAKEVMSKTKDDDEDSGSMFSEDFQKALIMVSRKLKDNMFRIEEEITPEPDPTSAPLGEPLVS